MNESETPRTDYEIDDARNFALDFECRAKPKETDPPPLVVPAGFARQLERELAARDAELEEKRWLMADLTAAIENKNADIARLKSCHDELLEIHKVIMCRRA